jgi:hypothetical protein
LLKGATKPTIDSNPNQTFFSMFLISVTSLETKTTFR